MLKAGIIGLPNVGKSTLFNAITRSHKGAAENYPFCTIEPNLGVVTVPDPRLPNLGKPANTLGLPLALEEKSIVRSFFLLTDKPILFAANVKESELASIETNPQVTKVREYARVHHACDTVA